mgnify:CR=1 FL=1
MLFHLLQTDTLGAVADSLAEAVQSAAPAAPAQMSESLFSMFRMGGPLMWVLLVLSIIAIYIIGWKWWTINQASKINPNFMNDIRDYLNDGKMKSAVTLCRKYDNPVARMIETGIHRLGRPMADIQSAIENTGNVEVARLEKGLPLLATIAGGAPMIGFLGTVMGMVQAFFNMSKAGANIDISLLSGWEHKGGRRMPARPSQVFLQYKPAGLWNAITAPIRDYPFAGVIWYQGENNCSNAAEYGSLLEKMVDSWRTEASDPDLPFYIIELAAFEHSELTDNDWGWNRVQKEQRRTAERVNGAYLVPNADLGEWNDIHPQDKKTVGQRTASVILEHTKP